jgi:hypothetical protein
MSNNEENEIFGWSKKDMEIPPWESEIPLDSDKPKLDIFDELRHADMGNKDFYAGLTPDLKKQFSPLVAMRWFSAAQDTSVYKEYVLCLVNEMLNVDFWSIREHPELQWKIMSLCGPGKSIRRQWINMPKRRKISKVGEFMLQWFPSANDQELDILTGKITREDFEQFVKSTGCTEEEYKEVLDSFDIGRGIKPAKPTKAGGKKRKA